MKFVNVKSIEIGTNGAISFSQKNLQYTKQVIFFEKNTGTSPFFKKTRKNQLFQNSQQNFYKSKYKF